jgi:hypothetical protein
MEKPAVPETEKCMNIRMKDQIIIVTGYGLDNRTFGVLFLGGAGNFSLRHHAQTSFGAHPASYQMGNGISFPGVKWLGHEADLSPPSSAEVKECVELFLHPLIRLHGMECS